VVLATNYSAYTLEITPSRAAPLEETIDELAQGGGHPASATAAASSAAGRVAQL
jgi:hypothetical protein